MTLHGFLVALAVSSVVMVAVVGGLAVYAVGQLSKFGEYPPCDSPRCAPTRTELIARRSWPTPVPLTRQEAVDFTEWEKELR